MIYRSKLPVVYSLLLAVGLVGCIEDRYDGPMDGKQRPVVFAPQVASRAAAGHPIDNGATIPVGDYHFGVYGWVKLTAGALVEPFAELHNAKVQHASAAEYTYTPVASWPRDADARLVCMAYYPWSDQNGNIKVTTGVGANQTMTINYTVPADAGQHVDLMYAKTGMTAGYDPVNLDFRHALARLKFEGHIEGFPAGSEIKITGIKVTSAILRGDLIVLDPATQPGKPWWELSTAPGDRGDMTMPATHIRDVALTTTPQSMILTGGDMLVLPQAVAGLTVEVTATQDGTALSEPFVFLLDATPDWTMNEIITYEITICPNVSTIAASVSDWTTNTGTTVIDGQYRLEFSQPIVVFDNDGGTMSIDISTDYDGVDGAHPAGLYISTGTTASWLTITPGGSDGDMNRTVTVSAPSYISAADRETIVTITVGNLNYKYKVIQLKDPWLSVVREGFLLDGQIHRAQVNAISDWEVSIKPGTNLVNGNTPIKMLITTSGDSGINQPLSFESYDDMTGANPWMGVTRVTLVFADHNGLYIDKEVEIMLVSGIVRESSNCYILKPTDNPILIPVGRANNSAIGAQIGGDDPLWYDFVWGENAAGLAASSNLKDVGAAGRNTQGYVAVVPGSAEGNALVAVTTMDGSNNDVIRWSWHIWVLNNSNTPQNIGGWMDRDLGALRAGSWATTGAGGVGGPQYDPVVGLLYEWGRKDPFTGTSGRPSLSGSSYTVTSGSGNNLTTSIHRPTYNITNWTGSTGTNSWFNGGKTVYDPCPEGWYVPSQAQWPTSGWVRSNNGYSHANGGYFALYPTFNTGYWWSSTERVASESWFARLYYNDNGISWRNYEGNKTGLFHIRCIHQ